MFKDKLSFIQSIQNLKIDADSIQVNASGSVFVKVGKVNVSRHQLIDKIEKLVKKALEEEEADSEALKQFLSLKSTLINSVETTQVKGANAKIRRFFGNLFKMNHKKRLEKIESHFPVTLRIQAELLRYPELPPISAVLRNHFIKKLAEEGIVTTLKNFEEMKSALERCKNSALIAQFLQFYKTSGFEEKLLQKAVACFKEAGIVIDLTPENFIDIFEKVRSLEYNQDKTPFFLQALGILSHLKIAYENEKK